MKVEPVHQFTPVITETDIPNTRLPKTTPTPPPPVTSKGSNVPLPDNFQRQPGDITTYTNTPPVPSPGIGPQARTDMDMRIKNAKKFNLQTLPAIKRKIFEQIENSNLTKNNKIILARKMDKYLSTKNITTDQVYGGKFLSFAASFAKGAYEAIPILPEVFKVADMAGIKPTTTQKIGGALGQLVTVGTLMAAAPELDFPAFGEYAAKLGVNEKVASSVYKAVKSAGNFAAAEGATTGTNTIVKGGIEGRPAKDIAKDFLKTLAGSAGTGAKVGAISDVINRIIPNPIISFGAKIIATTLADYATNGEQMDKQDIGDWIVQIGNNAILSLNGKPEKLKAYTKLNFAKALSEAVKKKSGIEGAIKLLNAEQQDMAKKAKNPNAYIMGELTNNFRKILDSPENKKGFEEFKKELMADTKEKAARVNQLNSDINTLQKEVNIGVEKSKQGAVKTTTETLTPEGPVTTQKTEVSKEPVERSTTIETNKVESYTNSAPVKKQIDLLKSIKDNYIKFRNKYNKLVTIKNKNGKPVMRLTDEGKKLINLANDKINNKQIQSGIPKDTIVKATEFKNDYDKLQRLKKENRTAKSSLKEQQQKTGKYMVETTKTVNGDQVEHTRKAVDDVNNLKLSERTESYPGKLSKKTQKKMDKLKNLEKERYEINTDLGEKARVKRNKKGKVVHDKKGEPVIEINPEKIISEAEDKYTSLKYREKFNELRKDMAEKYNDKTLKAKADEIEAKMKEAREVYDELDWKEFNDLSKDEMDAVIRDTFGDKKAAKIKNDIKRAKKSGVKRIVDDILSGELISSEEGGGDPAKFITNLAMKIKEKYNIDTELSRRNLLELGYSYKQINTVWQRLFKHFKPMNWEARAWFREANTTISDIFNKYEHIQADIVNDISTYTKILTDGEKEIFFNKVIPEALKRAVKSKDFNPAKNIEEAEKFIQDVTKITDKDQIRNLALSLTDINKGLAEAKKIMLNLIGKRLGKDSSEYKSLENRNHFYFPLTRDSKGMNYTVTVVDKKTKTPYYFGFEKTPENAKKTDALIRSGDIKLSNGKEQGITFDPNKYDILHREKSTISSMFEPHESIFALSSANEAITNFFNKVANDPDYLGRADVTKEALENLKRNIQKDVNATLLSKTNTTSHLKEQKLIAGFTMNDMDKAVKSYIKNLINSARNEDIADFGISLLNDMRKLKAPADSIKDLSIIIHDVLSGSDKKAVAKLSRILGSIAAFRYMAFRPSTGVYNLLSAIPNTFLSTSYLKGMKGSVTIEMAKAFKDIAKYEKYIRDFKKNKLTKEPAWLSERDKEALFYAYTHGAADTPYTDMVNDFLNSDMKLTKDIIDAGYMFMKLTERPARAVTFLTVFRMLDKNSNTLEAKRNIYKLYNKLRYDKEKPFKDAELTNEKMQKIKTYIATNLLKKSHGDYSKYNKTLIERNKYVGPVATMMMKLWKYSINQIIAYSNATMSKDTDKSRVVGALVSLFLIGGTRALPGATTAKDAYEWIASTVHGYYQPSAFGQFLDKSSVWSRGIPTLVGIDLSGGTAINVPTGSIVSSTVRDIKRGYNEITYGHVAKGVTRIAGLQPSNIYNAFERRFGTPTTLHGYVQRYKGKPLNKYNNFEFMVKLLGGSPSSQEAEFTRGQWTQSKIITSFNKFKDKKMTQMRKALAKHNHKRIRELAKQVRAVAKVLLKNYKNEYPGLKKAIRPVMRPVKLYKDVQ